MKIKLNNFIEKLVNPTIYVPGTFDMYNIGHIRLFKYAKDSFYYSTVIAGISTDKLVKSYKYIKSIHSLKERLETVLACKYVDKAIIQKKFFDVKQLKKYNIDYVLLGDDWKGKSFPSLENAQKILQFKIIYKPYTKSVSSSEIQKRIIQNAYEIVQAQTKRNNE